MGNLKTKESLPINLLLCDCEEQKFLITPRNKETSHSEYIQSNALTNHFLREMRTEEFK